MESVTITLDHYKELEYKVKVLSDKDKNKEIVQLQTLLKNKKAYIDTLEEKLKSKRPCRLCRLLGKK